MACLPFVEFMGRTVLVGILHMSLSVYQDARTNIFSKRLLQALLCHCIPIVKRKKHDNKGQLLEGTVVINIILGPGRLTAAMDNIIFHEKMHKEGVNIELGLPKSTAVT